MERFANNKLKRAIIEKLLSPTVFIKYDVINKNNQLETIDKIIPNINSTYAIQLLLELSKRQNSFGQVEGVHHCEFENLLGCSKQTFYSAIYALRDREYIAATKNKYGYWTILIHNNIFLNEKDDREGYLNTNREIFYTDKFKTLTANSKKICLYLLLNKNPLMLDKDTMYPETFAKRIGVKVVSVIKKSLEAIQCFFPHEWVKGKQGGMIRFKATTCPINNESEKYNYALHKIKYFCKFYKIEFTDDTLKDTSKLLCQYRELSPDKFFKVLCNSIGWIKKSGRSLQPKLLNSLCKSILDSIRDPKTVFQ